jgi:hypothetical protein
LKTWASRILPAKVFSRGGAAIVKERLYIWGVLALTYRHQLVSLAIITAVIVVEPP